MPQHVEVYPYLTLTNLNSLYATARQDIVSQVPSVSARR